MLITSILKSRCPRCRKGYLFVNSNPYNLSMLATMHKNCKFCGQPSQPEPGFYFGAMYVSYGLGVILFAVTMILTEAVFEIGGFHFMWIYTLLMLTLWPVIFRISRVVYIYMFIKYNPNL